MFLIKEMPLHERPRERFIKAGKDALSNQELLAILLRTGTKSISVLELAKTLYFKYGTLKKLNQATLTELTSIGGLGKAKAVQVLAALELGKRLSQENFPSLLALTRPNLVFEFMKDELEMQTQEMFYALYLDTKGHLIQKQLLFIGSLNSAIVHPREVFKHAVMLSAASLIMVHNHPSGNPEPSESDKQMTKTMVENGRLMDIEVLDHIIIGKGRFYSFREHKQF